MYLGQVVPISGVGDDDGDACSSDLVTDDSSDSLDTSDSDDQPNQSSAFLMPLTALFSRARAGLIGRVHSHCIASELEKLAEAERRITNEISSLRDTLQSRVTGKCATEDYNLPVDMAGV